MVALRKKKEISIKLINLQKSKINLRRQIKTLHAKQLKVFDNPMLFTFETNVALPKAWENGYEEGGCDIKEIFKNGVYRNGSNISMDTSEKSFEGESNWLALVLQPYSSAENSNKLRMLL